MLAWIIENIANILISVALAAVVTLIIIKRINDKKKGKSSCGCSCSCCPMADKCRK